MLSWIVFGVAGVITLTLLYIGFFQDRSRGRPRCPKCWYNMTGAPSLVCPECGHDARHERRLYRTRRRRWAVRCAVMMAMCSMYLWYVKVRAVRLRESFADALKPTVWYLLTVPNASSSDQLLLGQRFDRFGLWPWESWILLFQFDREAVETNPIVGSWIQNVVVAGRHSDRVVDHVVAYCDHPNASIRSVALQSAIEHLDRLDDAQLGRALDAVIKTDKELGTKYAEMFLAESARRPAFREKTKHILDHLVELASSGELNVAWRPRLLVGSHAGWLSDDQLVMLFETAMKTERSYSISSDCFLAEMVRRKRPAFREQIQRWAASPPIDEMFHVPLNLELATALRRFDGHPDPLRIFLSGATSPIECKSSQLPIVQASIRNVDSAGAAVGFREGGDYRSGREARWRLEVCDDDGQRWPIKPDRWREGTGIFHFRVLHVGESYQTTLDMNQYVGPLPPGRYRVVVQYHNSFAIANNESMENRIVSSSEPFELVVRSP